MRSTECPSSYCHMFVFTVISLFILFIRICFKHIILYIGDAFTTLLNDFTSKERADHCSKSVTILPDHCGCINNAE